MDSNKKIYWILGSLSLIGYAWIGFNAGHIHQHETLTLCLFKNVTGIPCPACGTTRSILLLLNGNFMDAFTLNPFGVLAAVLLVIIPGWIAWDILKKKSSLLFMYRLTEQKIQTKKALYLPMIGLTLLNWFWNITKEL